MLFTHAAQNIEFVVGADLWLPEVKFTSGSEWLALVCSVSECEFEAASLSVRPEKRQDHYDDSEIDGQRLVFTRVGQSGEVMAWFRKRDELPRLATRKSRPSHRKSVRCCALGLQVRSKSRSIYRAAGTLCSCHCFDQSTGGVQLQFRTDTQRQMLGGLADCPHTYSTSYFVWAGDLDRDGPNTSSASLIRPLITRAGESRARWRQVP